MKLIIAQLAKKFYVFYGSWSFIIDFTRAQKLKPNLHQLKPVHTLTTYIFYILFNIILPFTASSPKYIFSSGFPTKDFMHLHLSDAWYRACLLIFLFGYLIMLVEKHNIWLQKFLHPHVAISLLRPNIPLSTLYLFIISLCSIRSASKVQCEMHEVLYLQSNSETEEGMRISPWQLKKY